MRICLNMIVRNEAAVIERCLQSVRPYIHCWAIADTGSSDGTQDIVRRVLADLPGEIIQRPWVDFATNRNEALQLARRYGDYALFVDADDTLDVDPGFDFSALDGAFYAFDKPVHGVSGWTPGLVRLDIDWVWQGVLHEVLVSPTPVPRLRLPNVRIRALDGRVRASVGVRENYARDAEILRAALEREPDNTRYQFYLGRSLVERGQWRAALDAFRRRGQAGGADEEVYVAKLMVAVLSEQLGAANDDEIVAAYLEAFRLRPRRAEALSHLAHFMNKRGRFAETCLYARAALGTPISSDGLMVDRAAHGWRPRDDLAVALFELGEIAASVRIYREMLGDPGLPDSERARVQRNLAESERILVARRARPT